MDNDATDMWQYICCVHTYLSTFLIYGQICIILIGCDVNPAGFPIYAAAGLITMDQPEHGHFQADSLVSIFQRFRTACHHVFDGACSQRNVKHTGQDFVRTVNADCTNGVESHNHRLKVFAILDSCLYVFRK